MADNQLSRQEKAWLKKFQKLMDECPSNSWAAFTVGDSSITLYDSSYNEQINATMDRSIKDFVVVVGELDCQVANITMPFQVHSTAG